jgi:hypothetical protein
MATKPKTNKLPAAKTNRLGLAQREALLAWISDGLQTDEINERAAAFSPPFSVSRQQVDHYRKTREVKLKEIVARGEDDALTTGLALRSERVRKLKMLAARMERDLFGEGRADRLWVQDVKALGSGPWMTVVDFETFNAAEVRQYRETLDDIAKEVGERSTKVEHTGKDGEDLMLSIVLAPPPAAKQ